MRAGYLGTGSAHLTRTCRRMPGPRPSALAPGSQFVQARAPDVS